jgi:hypothetical protein
MTSEQPNPQIAGFIRSDVDTMQLPKNFDERTWWILPCIIGGLIAIASAPARFIPGFFVGLGLLLFAIGQWKDFPIQTSKSGGATTKYFWQ